MALFRSARRGDRAIGWRDWLVAYGAVWTLPVPVGLTVAIIAMLWRWPFETMGWPVAADAASAYVFGLGMVMIFVPAFSWLGLLLSVPVVWLVMRLGLGGWASYAMGGGAMGAVSAGALGGMALPAPVALGVLSALALRITLRWMRPELFNPAHNGHSGTAAT